MFKYCHKCFRFLLIQLFDLKMPPFWFVEYEQGTHKHQIKLTKQTKRMKTKRRNKLKWFKTINTTEMKKEVYDEENMMI